MKRLFTVSLSLSFLLLAMTSLPVLGKHKPATPAFIAFGDAPYGPQGEKEFPKLIQKINATPAAFAVHIGDIKNGRSPCSNEHFQKIHALFQTFSGALVYTPGDNEWTDCHRSSNGSYDPLERLRALRQVFFKTPGTSLGQKPIALQSQARGGAHQTFRENAIWDNHGAVFATVHMVGSYNNVERNAASTQEFLKRNAANLAWLRTAFAQAKQQDAKAVVVLTQANPWMESTTGFVVVGGFLEFMSELNALTKDFKKPVLFVHGDTHTYRHDKKDVSPEFRDLANFYRLEVFGDEETGAVLVKMDFSKDAPFSYETIRP